MRLNPQDRALIVNALYEKAEGDRKAASVIGKDYANTAIHLVYQAQRSEELAGAIEGAESI